MGAAPVTKGSPEFWEPRRARIPDLAGQGGRVRSCAPGARFGVTPETIRREIQRPGLLGRLSELAAQAPGPSRGVSRAASSFPRSVA